MGLETGLILEKSVFKFPVKPKFIDALILIIYSKPLLVKCYLRNINSAAFFLKVVGLFFLLNRGYLSGPPSFSKNKQIKRGGGELLLELYLEEKIPDIG
jgi:hypothetical protein